MNVGRCQGIRLRDGHYGIVKSQKVYDRSWERVSNVKTATFNDFPIQVLSFYEDRNFRRPPATYASRDLPKKR